MTAEIAILNKTAVALATDSAVTISAGSKEEKIYDSADKLFELCTQNPIGVMIYNGMSFMEAPLPSLIKKFRSECGAFDRVSDAAEEFLRYLNEFGRKAPTEVKYNTIRSIVHPLIAQIQRRFWAKVQKLIADEKRGRGGNDIRARVSDFLDEEIGLYEKVLGAKPDALFANNGAFRITKSIVNVLGEIIKSVAPFANDEQQQRLIELGKQALRKNQLSDGVTGIVFAGFGSKDLFPTLLSYEIDGVVCGTLKYVKTNDVDIDRVGTKASVLPFAQKEMVERFLFGIDENTQEEIGRFCEKTISDISKRILDGLEFSSEGDASVLRMEARQAEAAFVKGLETLAFEKTRSRSQAEIEDMVEFMPKPEMAKMAEALVNLTSIKRRVSRGMETVRDPIDVAVISQAEGFVWVKRKHYFPPELNARFFSRVQQQTNGHQGTANGPDAESRSARAKGRGKASPASRPRRNVSRSSSSRRGHEE